ncbi:FabD/lysophospholipase-like protein [Conidiobolus coronatus NRRL 28638]|uniref:FabD/lysophospholipase-like protein n=1 Tax=Conidiobolus coronatus (strain ATCC 28846 / CBS 209.66 / NRRL 28638) TaxID=796925 RepID=A0A137P4E9_CONC2|nr:FabD/lysophospholipase-like protein [Conidiobolus coronatus NRRL 28638]|eukprot:KXN69898.1 FabD/lysophospholipase-like protein [Conidiobolus coronatus NRRL 28638]
MDKLFKSILNSSTVDQLSKGSKSMEKDSTEDVDTNPPSLEKQGKDRSKSSPIPAPVSENTRVNTTAGISIDPDEELNTLKKKLRDEYLSLREKKFLFAGSGDSNVVDRSPKSDNDPDETIIYEKSAEHPDNMRFVKAEEASKEFIIENNDKNPYLTPISPNQAIEDVKDEDDNPSFKIPGEHFSGNTTDTQDSLPGNSSSSNDNGVRLDSNPEIIENTPILQKSNSFSTATESLTSPDPDLIGTLERIPTPNEVSPLIPQKKLDETSANSNADQPNSSKLVGAELAVGIGAIGAAILGEINKLKNKASGIDNSVPNVVTEKEIHNSLSDNLKPKDSILEKPISDVEKKVGDVEEAIDSKKESLHNRTASFQQADIDRSPSSIKEAKPAVVVKPTDREITDVVLDQAPNEKVEEVKAEGLFGTEESIPIVPGPPLSDNADIDPGVDPIANPEILRSRSKYFRILSIDGGGIKGIIPGVILKEIEKAAGIPACHLFDLIAGTSTGGILAALSAIPDGEPTKKFDSVEQQNKEFTFQPEKRKPKYDADQRLDLYKRFGPQIFKRSAWQKFKTLGGIRRAKYPNSQKRKVIDQFVGDLRMKDLMTDVVVPSFDMRSGQPYFFRSSLARADPKYDFKVADMVDATSCAPTLFEPLFLKGYDSDPKFGYRALVDGALVANSPALCGVIEAIRTYKVKPEEIVLVSLGCGKLKKGGVSYQQATSWNTIKWAEFIPDVLTTASIETVHFQVDELLPELNLYLFQPEIDERYSKLDDVAKRNLDHLEKQAEQVAKDNKEKISKIVQMLTVLK